MRTSIFVRILVATLLPVLLVFLLVLSTARNVIHAEGLAYEREFVRLAAKQLSVQTSEKIESVSILQNDFSKKMAEIRFDSPSAESDAASLLSAFALSSRDIYSVWFAFEPGIMPGGGRYCKALLREGGRIREIDFLSDDILNDPHKSPWYSVPLYLREVYSDLESSHDFGTGEGLVRVFTMSYPILSDDGRQIGCLGLNVRYENLFSVSGIIDRDDQKVMLISGEEIILFSSDREDMGKTLWDYGFQDNEALALSIRDKAVWQEEILSPPGAKLLACVYPMKIGHSGKTIFLYRDTPADSLYNSFYVSMKTIIVTGLLGVILLSVCVYFTTRGIAGQVKRITENFHLVANEGAEGTLNGKHIPTFQTNVIELDMLQAALRSMMSHLRRAHGHMMKAVEAEVEKEKVIAASQAKTKFFAIMSHEIRTPMNAILGISEIMLLEGGLTPAQEKYIQDIRISSDALLNIINDILDISKMESGKMELHPEHYNFKALIDNIVSLAAHLASDANLRLIVESEDNLPAYLYGDSVRLRQVLLNLIGNAVKFTRQGRIYLRIFLQGKTMCFDVVDSGVGIKEEEMDSLFEVFKRIDTWRNREVKGSGLGLSISKNLIELMGGTISVTSVFEKGSTFSVKIPLVIGDKDKVRRVRPGKGSQYADSLRVLVVDDDETNLNVSSGLLKAAHGILCDTAISGLEAIKKVQETDYDIIFMDQMMPGLDGLETTKCIRRLGGRFESIPVIALTANAVIGTKQEVIDGGMSDFLSKPIQSEMLQAILDLWVPAEKRPAITVEGASPPSSAGEEGKLSESGLTYHIWGEPLEKAGINVLGGLENIGFDEEMYLQSLWFFQRRLPQTVQQLEDLLNQKNIKDFHIHIHGLKGSLSSIGAINLSEDAKRLELAASKENFDYCESYLPTYAERLRQFCEALGKALPSIEVSGEKKPFDQERLNGCLNELCAALEDFEYEAIINWLNMILSMELGKEIERPIARLKHLIDSFDYLDAVTLIRDQLLTDKEQ